MKRKRDENNTSAAVESPAPSAVENGHQDGAESPTLSFSDLGLDSRLLQAIQQEGYHEPTLVQRRAIPVALEGKSVLAKAKTGSGKTAAYVLPLLQAVLQRKQSSSTAFTAGLVLVPTRELSDQVYKVIESLSAFCAKDIQVVKLTDKVSDAVQRSLLSNTPDMVVSTPSRAWGNIRSGALSLDNLSHLVLDEADLLLSFGYEEDLQNIASRVPKGIQTSLMSASLTTDVESLKGIFCHEPVFLNLEEEEAEDGGLSQYVVKCAEDEKFLIIYLIVKLQLIKGKKIIFVSDVDRCYRLKLYFEQFGIRSCILNHEMPINIRTRVVDEFNKNVYEVIIASDESEVLGDDEVDQEGEGEGELIDNDREKQEDDEAVQPKKRRTTKELEKSAPKKKRKSRKDRESGTRGIDFKNVASVINFDLPTSSRSYTHRIGRTARAGQTGMALSFVVPRQYYRKHIPTTVESAENDEKVLAKVVRQQEKKGRTIEPWVFDKKELESFRYRANDALRAVSRVAVREARTRELRQELLKSAKLERHFEENPSEMQHLIRHDGEIRAARTQAHLRNVPDYLLPKDGTKALTENDIGFVPIRTKSGRKDRRQKGKGHHGRSFKVGKKKADPLKSFKARSKR